MGTRAIALGVFGDAVRKKILYLLLLFAGALVLTIPVIPSFGVGVRVDLFRDLALGLTSLFGVVIAVALGAGQIPGEVEKRTVYNVLSKPITRAGFVAGKLLGLLLTMAVVIFAMIGISLLGTLLYFGKVDPGLFVAGWAILVEVSVIAAFVTMISTIASPPVTATLTVLFYFVAHVKESFLAQVLSDGGAAMLPLRVISYVVPSLEGFSANELVSHGVAVPLGRTGAVTAQGALYVVAFLIVGAALFHRRDL